MKLVWRATLALMCLLAAVGVWWYRTARLRELPCPPWLSWFVETPLAAWCMEAA